VNTPPKMVAEGVVTTKNGCDCGVTAKNGWCHHQNRENIDFPALSPPKAH